jgi:hypothetical protein
LTVPTLTSPTLAEPRITAAKFKSLLQTKNSPAVAASDLIYGILVDQGVDPSFALAQYRVESQYGTAGHAKVTGSWGNMLYDSNLTILADGKYSPGNGYTYARYSDFENAVLDYCRYIHWYKDRYGLTTIYGATARWIGKTPGSAGHINYVTIVMNDMIEYEYPDGGYESGDVMIYAGDAFDKATGRIVQKYPVTYGMDLYRGTDGTFLKKYSGKAGDAWWLGHPNNNKAWGTIFIGTSVADPDATLVYIKNPDPNKIKNV